MAPIVGENRAIARLGLDRMRAGGRPGLAALLSRAGVAPAERGPRDGLVRPRPADQRRRADGRGDRRGGAAPRRRRRDGDRPGRPARGGQQRPADADQGDARSGRGGRSCRRRRGGRDRAGDRRARPVAGRASWGSSRPGSPRTGRGRSSSARRSAMSCGPRAGRPASTWPRPSRHARDLFIRHGGHAGAAGFEIEASRWDAFRERFMEAASRSVRPVADPRPELRLDLALAARDVDYPLLRELAWLAPTGLGQPRATHRDPRPDGHAGPPREGRAHPTHAPSRARRPRRDRVRPLGPGGERRGRRPGRHRGDARVADLRRVRVAPAPRPRRGPERQPPGGRGDPRDRCPGHGSRPAGPRPALATAVVGGPDR